MKKVVSRAKKAYSKPVSKFFVDEEILVEIAKLVKAIDDQLVEYRFNTDKDGSSIIDGKACILAKVKEGMVSSLKDEFYHTALISENTLWKWQDYLGSFEESGYLLYREHISELSKWAKVVDGWYNRTWKYAVLKLVRDFNLDTQPREYVDVFKADFMGVKSQKEFNSVYLKWNDLIYWSPWKLSLYDVVVQPKSAHYEADFNDDIDVYDDCLCEDM